jgi:hypothetical protein
MAVRGFGTLVRLRPKHEYVDEADDVLVLGVLDMCIYGFLHVHSRS